MSDTKWTPGPWKPHATGLARSGKPEHEIHWSDDGECIAEIVHGEPEANLMAASPRLYRALSLMVTAFSDGPIKHSEDAKASAIQHALDAMAEARGQS